MGGPKLPSHGGHLGAASAARKASGRGSNNGALGFRVCLLKKSLRATHAFQQLGEDEEKGHVVTQHPTLKKRVLKYNPWGSAVLESFAGSSFRV